MGVSLKKRKTGSGGSASDVESEDSEDERPLRNPGNPNAVPFPLLKATILKYKDIYDHMIIPRAFIVPCNDPWPAEMWGVKLGQLSVRVRGSNYRGGYAVHRAELVSGGMVFGLCISYSCSCSLIYS
jgi:hypothetical protein